MAKLPSDVDLGASPSANSGRPIASYDVTGYARGAAALAGGVQDIGKGAQSAVRDVAAVQAQQNSDTDTLEEARAHSNYLIKTKQLRDEISTATDPTDLEKTYAPKFQAAYDESAAMISNPRKRELWTLKTAPDLTGQNLAVGDKAYDLQKTQTIASTNQQLDDIRNSALKTNDPAERAKFIAAGHQLLAGLKTAGYIDAVKEQQVRKKWTEDYAVSAIEMMPPEERVKVLSPTIQGRDAVLDQIKLVEGSGKNPASSATGDFQFTNGTWLGTIRAHRPDLLQGRDEKSVLALRNDPKVAREMAGYLLDDNAAALKSQGVEATPANLYLAHFLGASDAAKVLKAAPGTPVSDIISPTSIAANPSILNGKTAGTVADWSSGKMGGSQKGGLVDFIPADKRVDMARTAQIQVDRAAAKAAVDRSEVYDRQITDAAAGIGSLPPRASIEGDPSLDEPRRNALLRQHDAAAGDIIQLDRAATKFRDPNAGSFNPFDKTDRDNVDKIYSILGGDDAALQSVVQRTGMVPKSAALALRGGLNSSDPAKVQSSLQLAANLTGGPATDVFAGVDGGKGLSEAGLTFREYVYGRGMTAADATKKIMEERTPEFERNVKAKIKAEDLGDIVKKQLKDTDIRSAFDPSFMGLAPNPQLAFNPETRQRAMGDYETAFRDNFMKNGDVELSKKLALEEMKKTWGVTSVNGTKTVMKYPPERSPAYAGIENPSEHIAEQAVSAIKDVNGSDVDRSKIRLDEVRTTGERYVNGQPPTYVLSYVDKNGHVQTIPKQFYADPALMRDKQTAARAAASAKIQERVALDADMADLKRAPFGVAP